MTRREIARLPTDPKHRELLRRLHAAPPGEIGNRRRELRDYVTRTLRDAKVSPQSTDRPTGQVRA